MFVIFARQLVFLENDCDTLVEVIPKNSRFIALAVLKSVVNENKSVIQTSLQERFSLLHCINPL